MKRLLALFALVLGLALPLLAEESNRRAYEAEKERAKAKAAAELALGSHKATAPAPIVFRTDYAAALREAAKTGKPLFLDVRSSPCIWCDQLEKGPLRDARVVEALKGYVLVRVKFDENPKLANELASKNKFGASLFPTLLIAAPDGKILRSTSGYIEAEPLRKWITGETTAAQRDAAFFVCGCSYGRTCACEVAGKWCLCEDWPIVATQTAQR